MHTGPVPGWYKQRLWGTGPAGLHCGLRVSFRNTHPPAPPPQPALLNMDIRTQDSQTLHYPTLRDRATTQTNVTNHICKIWELQTMNELGSWAAMGVLCLLARRWFSKRPLCADKLSPLISAGRRWSGRAWPQTQVVPSQWCGTAFVLT